MPVQKHAPAEKGQTFCNGSASTSAPTNPAAAAATAMSNAKADEDFYLSYKMCPSVTASQSWPYEVEFDKYVKKRNYCSTTVNRMTAMINNKAGQNAQNGKKLTSSTRSAANDERIQSTQSNSSLKNILNLNTKSFPMKSLFLNNCNIVYNYDPSKTETSNKSGTLSALLPSFAH